MIARLALAESGPRLLRPRQLGPPRRLLVVVSDELSTATPPHSWPTPAAPSGVLEARFGTTRLYARAALGETAGATRGLPETRHLHSTMVPEQALRARRATNARARRARRPRRLSRFAFRDAATIRRRRRAAVLGLVLVGGFVLGSVALRSHVWSNRELGALAAQLASLQRARVTIAELDLEAHGLQADADLAPPPRIAPAGLLSQIAETLEPGELVRSFRVSGDRLTLVVRSARGLGVVRSIGALEGVHDATGVVRTGDDDATVTVEARAGDAR